MRADSVEGLSGPEDDRDYLFSALLDIAPGGQGGFDVTGRTPASPARVIVTVARFPRSAVIKIDMAPS
jgi:hypothetical protein